MRSGEMIVGLVPPEDMEVLEMLEMSELEAIKKKVLEGKKKELSGVELLAYILGICKSRTSSLAVVEDLLSYFEGWDGLLSATRKELVEFNQLEKNQIELILALGKLEKLMKTMEN